MSLDMGRLPLRRDHPLGRSAKREAGLRTSGSMPIHPPSQPEGQWLRLRAWVAAPRLPRRARAGFTPASRFSPPSAGHLANVVPVPTLPTGLSPSGSGTGYGSSNPGFGWCRSPSATLPTALVASWARCLQRETDHLHDIVHVDRLAAKIRRRILTATLSDDHSRSRQGVGRGVVRPGPRGGGGWTPLPGTTFRDLEPVELISRTVWHGRDHDGRGHRRLGRGSAGTDRRVGVVVQP